MVTNDRVVYLCRDAAKWIIQSFLPVKVPVCRDLIAASSFGRAVDLQIRHINERYTFVQAEKYVVMPNHIHLILRVRGQNGRWGTPAPTANAQIPPLGIHL